LLGSVASGGGVGFSDDESADQIADRRPCRFL